MNRNRKIAKKYVFYKAVVEGKKNKDKSESGEGNETK